jgi:ribosomal subunit interface protein
MQIQVSGKGVDIGESFRTYAQTKLEEGVQKYIDRVIGLDVVVSRESHLFNVNIHGNTGTASGIIIKSSGQAQDVYAALDSAAEKIEKQLRRYKRKLTDHHKQQHQLQDFQAVKYVISAEEKAEAEAEQPIIIAEKATRINTLTVSEAVMRMNLAELPALMFHNAASGRLNVVYKRGDGNISWVDPAEEALKKDKVA